MADGRKLIEMDDKKSHGAKTEGWNIMLKGGSHVCFCDSPRLPTLHCAWLCKGGSKSSIFGIPSGQVVIGSVWDGGGTELTRGSGLLIE